MENNSQVQGQKSGLAIASFVLSLFILIPFTELVALILGIISLVKISKSNGKLLGKNLALTGVIIGGIRLIVIPIIIAAMLPCCIYNNEMIQRTAAAENLHQTAIAIYAYAKDNNGMLPEKLHQLIEEGYLTKEQLDEEFIYNLKGGYYYHSPGKNLYKMESDIIIITDPKSGYLLYADGHIELQLNE